MDVARHVGMSKTSVSAALTGSGRLAEETRDIVLKAARELNYQAHPYAQSLRKKNSGEIVLVSENMDVGVVTRKMALIQQGLSAKGFNVPIYAYSHGDDVGVNQHALLATVGRVSPLAVVCNVATLSARSRDLLLNLQAAGTAVVCYDFEIPDEAAAPQLDQIIFDREDNTYRAARHLLDLGHRDLGLVYFGNSLTAPLRLGGFERALREAGIAVRAEWLFPGYVPDSAADLEFVGAQAADYFYRMPNRPSGMCIINDLTAMAFMGEMSRAGVRVPRDMSVIGHDDIPICQFAPLRLSSVEHPVETIAQAVVQRLLDRLNDPGAVAVKQWIRGEVRGRESTSPPGQPASGTTKNVPLQFRPLPAEDHHASFSL